MDFEAIMKTQQEWLDRAVSSLGKPGDDAPVPDELREESVRLARARIDRLQAQRKAILSRLDAAIAEETEAIARIENLPGTKGRAAGGTEAPTISAGKPGKRPRQARAAKRKG